MKRTPKFVAEECLGKSERCAISQDLWINLSKTKTDSRLDLERPQSSRSGLLRESKLISRQVVRNIETPLSSPHRYSDMLARPLFEHLFLAQTLTKPMMLTKSTVHARGARISDDEGIAAPQDSVFV